MMNLMMMMMNKKVDWSFWKKLGECRFSMLCNYPNDTSLILN